ncbi:MAG: response regulator transcription factor [Deltaproteobacteria bacterium]|nr:response regulator transcription factor [Deltaproteobacteria bacterium]
MRHYRIFLADDHVLVRRGIRKLLEEAEDMAVVGEAGDGLELLRQLRAVAADLVILDISMPRLRGMEAIREIRSTFPDVKILVLTMHRRAEYLQHALSAGANGYLLKEDADAELFEAIEAIRKGRVYLSALLSAGLAEEFTKLCRGQAGARAECLTTREREVLKLTAEGKTSKETAELLFISARTVDHHRASIMKKVGVKKVAELVKYAIREGYTSESI